MHAGQGSPKGSSKRHSCTVHIKHQDCDSLSTTTRNTKATVVRAVARCHCKGRQHLSLHKLYKSALQRRRGRAPPTLTTVHAKARLVAPRGCPTLTTAHHNVHHAKHHQPAPTCSRSRASRNEVAVQLRQCSGRAQSAPIAPTCANRSACAVDQCHAIHQAKAPGARTSLCPTTSEIREEQAGKHRRRIDGTVFIRRAANRQPLYDFQGHVFVIFILLCTFGDFSLQPGESSVPKTCDLTATDPYYLGDDEDKILDDTWDDS